MRCRGRTSNAAPAYHEANCDATLSYENNFEPRRKNTAMLNRRQLLLASPSLVIPSVIGLNAFSCSATTINPPPLDPNLITAALNSLVNLVNSTEAGTMSPSELQSTSMALAQLFLNMQQSGTNNQMQSAVLANQSAILNTDPSPQTIQAFQDRSESAGANTSLGQMSSIFLTPVALRQEFLTELSGSGLLNIELQTSGGMLQIQNEIQAKLGRSGVALVLASAHLERVHATCPYTILSIAWAVLALFSPPPLDVACALISIWFQLVAALFC